MKKEKQNTINTVIGIANSPDIYADLLLSGEIRQRIDKRVCTALFQLAGDFLMEQKINGSAYFPSVPCQSAMENKKETLARLRDLQNILANRAAALFYLNTQKGYDFGSFSDIEYNLSEITKNDYWYILQEPEWVLLLSSLKSADVSVETKKNLRKIREAFSLHLYAFLVKKDSMRKEHLSIGKENQMEEDMAQMGWEALMKYLDQFDTSKPGNPYMNTHIVKNEINSKLNDYGQENRNDRVKRSKSEDNVRVDYKSHLLKTQSIDVLMQGMIANDKSTSNEIILKDEKSLDEYERAEALEDFKKLYQSITDPLERKILFRYYFDYDSWTQTTMARDLHISPIKLKKLRNNILAKAKELGLVT